MIDLAALLGRLLHIVCGRGMVILGLGVASGLDDVLGSRLFAVGLFRGFCSRHCLSSVEAPIGSGGYATAVEFTAHLTPGRRLLAGGWWQFDVDSEPAFVVVVLAPRSPNYESSL